MLATKGFEDPDTWRERCLELIDKDVPTAIEPASLGVVSHCPDTGRSNPPQCRRTLRGSHRWGIAVLAKGRLGTRYEIML